MFNKILKQFFLIILVCFINNQAIAITGQEISAKVSMWLVKEGIIATPLFSKNSSYKNCNNKIEIKKMFQNYKTIKVQCLDKNGFKLLLRVKNIKTVKSLNENNENNLHSKKNRTFKVLKLKRSLEKNDIIEISDIETFTVEKKHQTSFYSNKKEIIGRKLKKNLKMGQILHPRHFFEKFDINNGDIISIVSNVGKASVTVSGEAQNSGNLNDLIEVKNLKSGKIIKGYIKKNKIIKVFR